MISKRISLSHADLFHVYTFRALLRNLDVHRYMSGLEKNPECTCACSELLRSLNSFRKRAHHLSKPHIWKNRPEDEFIDPIEAGMLYHVIDSSKVSPDHWIEFPLICKVHFDSVGRSHYITFAQVPPFYWAFSLPLQRQDVPNTISDDMKTAQSVVKVHYKEAMSIASQLSQDFGQIMPGVNRELEARRKQLSVNHRIQEWYKELEKDKEDLQIEGKQLEAEEQTSKKTEKKLCEMIDDIQKKKEAKRAEIKKVHEDIEEHEEK